MLQQAACWSQPVVCPVPSCWMDRLNAASRCGSNLLVPKPDVWPDEGYFMDASHWGVCAMLGSAHMGMHPKATVHEYDCVLSAAVQLLLRTYMQLLSPIIHWIGPCAAVSVFGTVVDTSCMNAQHMRRWPQCALFFSGAQDSTIHWWMGAIRMHNPRQVLSRLCSAGAQCQGL
jgi:hypothetical protein